MDYYVCYDLDGEMILKGINTPVPRVGDFIKNISPDATETYQVKKVCFNFYKRNESYHDIDVFLEKVEE